MNGKIVSRPARRVAYGRGMSPFRPRSLLLAAAALVVSAQAPASAPPAIDHAGAQAIVEGVHAMLAGVLGTLAPASGLLHATVQGDHYRIEIPVAHRWNGGAVGGDSLGADLLPLGQGRWQVANGALPGRLEFSIDHPPPGVASLTTMTIKEGGFAGVIDTTLATPTQLDFHVADENLMGQGPQLSNGGHLDAARGSLLVTPAADGRVTVVSTSSLRGMRTTAVAGKLKTSSAVASASGSLRIDNLSLPALRAGVRAITTLATLPVPAPGTSGGTSTDPAVRKELHTLIADLASGATSISMQSSESGIALHGAGPVQGTIGHVGFGMRLAERNGSVALALRFVLEKPSFPAIVPAGILATFMPSRVVLRPRLAGIDAAALRRTLDAAVDSPEPNALPALAMAVLDAHPATVAIDSLLIDTGPARITGHGTLTVRGPGDAQGSATLRATGLDAAIKELSADPGGQQALGMLIFLKGLGKPEGDAVVWRLVFDGHKLLVNGNDISTLAPQAPK
jgi:hypothetical protein